MYSHIMLPKYNKRAVYVHADQKNFSQNWRACQTFRVDSVILWNLKCFIPPTKTPQHSIAHNIRLRVSKTLKTLSTRTSPTTSPNISQKHIPRTRSHFSTHFPNFLLAWKPLDNTTGINHRIESNRKSLSVILSYVPFECP